MIQCTRLASSSYTSRSVTILLADNGADAKRKNKRRKSGAMEQEISSRGWCLAQYDFRTSWAKYRLDAQSSSFLPYSSVSLATSQSVPFSLTVSTTTTTRLTVKCAIFFLLSTLHRMLVIHPFVMMWLNRSLAGECDGKKGGESRISANTPGWTFSIV